MVVLLAKRRAYASTFATGASAGSCSLHHLRGDRAAAGRTACRDELARDRARDRVRLERDQDAAPRLAKRRLANQLKSVATRGEGTQNLLCAYLAAAVLVGLLGNALFGLWWLDPAAALVIAAVALKETLASLVAVIEIWTPFVLVLGFTSSMVVATERATGRASPVLLQRFLF